MTASHLKIRSIAIGLNRPAAPDSGATLVDQLAAVMPGVTLPNRGVTMLYGTNNASNLMGHMMRQSVAADLDCQILDLTVETGRISQEKLTVDDAAKQKFLPTSYRLRSCAMDAINKQWNRYLAEEGLPAERFPRRMSDNMRLLDRLVEEKPYDQMVGISYMVRTIAGPTQLMTVFDTEAIGGDPRYPDSPIPDSGLVIEVPHKPGAQGIV